MTPGEQRRLLLTGHVTVVGRVLGSSNQALLVEVTDNEGRSGRACYKAERGERPLWDFPVGLWRREVAAYELDRVLHTGVVPVTVGREDLPFGEGSLQWWIEDGSEDHYFTLRDRDALAQWFIRLAAFDVVANNADRKSGHVIFDGHRCWAIDNGLSFHTDDKLRTVIWDFCDVAVPPPLRERLRRFGEGEIGELANWLDADELALTMWRADVLAEAGVLPRPDEDRDWPPYPWPLV
jgi:uncharacterized repeat protein (TIGR03843 family)